MPAIAEERRATLAHLRSGDLAGATRLIDELIEDLIDGHPGLGLLHANRIALAMIEGE